MQIEGFCTEIVGRLLHEVLRQLRRFLEAPQHEKVCDQFTRQGVGLGVALQTFFKNLYGLIVFSDALIGGCQVEREVLAFRFGSQKIDHRDRSHPQRESSC